MQIICRTCGFVDDKEKAIHPCDNCQSTNWKIDSYGNERFSRACPTCGQPFLLERVEELRLLTIKLTAGLTEIVDGYRFGRYPDSITHAEKLLKEIPIYQWCPVCQTKNGHTADCFLQAHLLSQLKGGKQ